MSDVIMLRIVVRRGAQHHHHALALDLVTRAHRAGLAGATMVEVIAGFGDAHRTRMAGRWALSDAVAYQILVVDSEDKIDRFLDEVRADIAERGFITKEPVTVISGRLGPSQA